MTSSVEENLGLEIYMNKYFLRGHGTSGKNRRETGHEQRIIFL
jgi:hypothetical protein